MVMETNGKIAAYCCQNSALKAASSITDPDVLESVEFIELPCSGKIEIGLVLKTLEKRYLGVLVLGCPIDNCKYVSGSDRARKRIESAKQILQSAGLDSDRIAMDFVSSVDTHRVEKIVRDMKARLTEKAAVAERSEQ